MSAGALPSPLAASPASDANAPAPDAAAASAAGTSLATALSAALGSLAADLAATGALLITIGPLSNRLASNVITPKSTDPSASLCAVVATGIGAFASAAVNVKVNSPVISGISTAELFVKRLNAFTGIWLSSYSKPATFVNSRVLGVVVSWAVATSLPV